MKWIQKDTATKTSTENMSIVEIPKPKPRLSITKKISVSKNNKTVAEVSVPTTSTKGTFVKTTNPEPSKPTATNVTTSLTTNMTQVTGSTRREKIVLCHRQ